VVKEHIRARTWELCRRGADYPGAGIRRARNDMTQRVLTIETTAGTPSRRGEPTSFTIDQVPSPAEASVTVDGHGSASWQVSGDDSLPPAPGIGRPPSPLAPPRGRARE